MRKHIIVSLLSLAILFSLTVNPPVANAFSLTASVQDVIQFILIKLGLASETAKPYEPLLEVSKQDQHVGSSTEQGIVSSFKLHSRIDSDNDSDAKISYSVTGSGVVPGSRFSFWTVKLSCPAGVTAVIGGADACGNKQRIRGGVQAEISIKNSTNQSQTINAVAELLSEKDGSVIATDVNAVKIESASDQETGIQLVSPVMNEQLKLGTSQTIRWTSTAKLENKRVYISLIDPIENIEYTIASGISNTGNYSWNVGQYLYNTITKTPGVLPAGNYSLKVDVGNIKAVSSITLTQAAQSPFRVLGDSIFLAPNDGSLTTYTPDPSTGKGGDEVRNGVFPVSVMKAFYKYHPDNFDFVLVLAPTFESPGFDGNAPVKNSVAGIGKSIADSSATYGSSGTLQSVVSIYNIESGLSQFAHEVSHQWLTYLSHPSLKINRDGSHWSQFLDTATREGGFLYFSPNGGSAFIDNGNGTFSLDNTTPLKTTLHHKFNSMELYLMGLLPASQVTPLTFWQTDSPQVTETMTGSKRVLTVQDLISVAGQRSPAYPNTQKDFKIGYIVLQKEGETIDPGIIEKVKYIAAEFPKAWSFMTGGLSSLK